MKKVLQLSNINPCVLEAQYAVRGQVVVKALEIEEQLKSKKHNFNFDQVIYCNIGNPQQLGQKPITFHRNVLSLCTSPELLSNTYSKKIFSEATLARAQEILAGIDGNTGAYTHSQGLPSVRKNVAKFIEERDGYPSNYERIFLTDGASPGIQLVLKTLIRNKSDAILIPLPQYPLYSASIDLFGGSQAHYYLNEDNIWGMDLAELEKGYQAAKDKGLNVRALVVINPGNPTGQILTARNQQQIVEFCVKNGIVLLADEVYQENIYDDKMKFHSFKKIACEMGGEFHPDNFEMFSFHSISKGFLGECGRRGGYMEVSNGVDSTIMEQLYKVASINLCPNVDGQIMMDLKIKPPKNDDVYEKEKNEILSSLKRRSIALVKALNEMKGVSCQPALGAMYVFPKIAIPKKAIEVATKNGMKPDLFYSLNLLSESGICVVPGSGFGQRDGTYHFRTTFLPPEDKMEVVVAKLKEFHEKFLDKYQ